MSPTGLVHWFLKAEENTYSTLLPHPFLFKGKRNARSRGSTGSCRDKEVAEAQILEDRRSKVSRSSVLVNDFHYCGNKQDLYKQSIGLAGNICSMVNLFLVVHKAQQTAARPTQNSCLVTRTKPLARTQSSEKEDGSQETWSHSLTQLQINLAKTQWKIM